MVPSGKGILEKLMNFFKDGNFWKTLKRETSLNLLKTRIYLSIGGEFGGVLEIRKSRKYVISRYLK